MKRMLLAASALALSLALAACSREAAAPVATQDPAPPPALADSGPRMVTSPDGVHIAYRVYGKGQPAVVLVHCWSCDSGYWREQLEALQGTYTVVTLDLAGHGASGRNRTDWSIGQYGEDVAAVVRELGLSRVVLVGHSMGGPVVLEAASRLEGAVIGIVGIDTFKRIGQPPPPQAAIDRRVEEFTRDFIGTTRRFVTQSFFTEQSDPRFVRQVADDMALAPPEVAIPTVVAVNAMKFEPLLAKITAPIVAINSDLPPPAHEASIRRLVPAFRVVVIEGTGHFLMLEHPERFNPVFLRELASFAGKANE